MISRLRALIACSILTLSFTSSHAATTEPGPFFDREQPLFHTQIAVPAATEAEQSNPNFVVRGVLIPLPSGHAIGFDQELLRVAGFWVVPPDQPPVTLETMAQISYGRPRNKAFTQHPVPTGALLLSTDMHPGVSSDLETLFSDPRPAPREGE